MVREGKTTRFWMIWLLAYDFSHSVLCSLLWILQKAGARMESCRSISLQYQVSTWLSRFSSNISTKFLVSAFELEKLIVLDLRQFVSPSRFKDTRQSYCKKLPSLITFSELILLLHPAFAVTMNMSTMEKESKTNLSISLSGCLAHR